MSKHKGWGCVVVTVASSFESKEDFELISSGKPLLILEWEEETTEVIFWGAVWNKLTKGYNPEAGNWEAVAKKQVQHCGEVDSKKP